MADNKNKGTQNSDIRAQHNKEHKKEKTTGNKTHNIRKNETESTREYTDSQPRLDTQTCNLARVAHTRSASPD